MLARLLDLLFPLRADEAVLRAVPPERFLALLDPELVALGGVNAAGLLPFTHPSVRAAIHEAKYRGSERAFALLGEALAEYLRDALTDQLEHYEKVILVPVPLGPARRKARGFNQVEEVAKRALEELPEITLEPGLLIRTRETLSQVALPRALRARNMRGAFSATRAANPAYLYIVLDDVLTTGATLSSALAALSASGATNILVVALAH